MSGKVKEFKLNEDGVDFEEMKNEPHYEAQANEFTDANTIFSSPEQLEILLDQKRYGQAIANFFQEVERDFVQWFHHQE